MYGTPSCSLKRQISPVCHANADDVQGWRRGYALDSAVSHREFVEPGALDEVPELHAALLAAHHDFVKVGVWVSHAGGRETISQVNGHLQGKA